MSLDEIKLVKKYLSNYNVKIIVYLRRQDEYLQSLYNQIVKIGIYSNNIHQYIKEKHPRCINYKDFLKLWEDVFGKENLIVRVYEKEQFKNRDLIEDFLQSINCTDYDNLTNLFFKTRSKENESPSLKIIKLIRLLNVLFPDQILFLKQIHLKINRQILKLSLNQSKLRTKIFIKIVDFFIKDIEDDLLSTSDKIEIMKKYDEANMTVAREYLGRKNSGLFYSTFSKDDKPS